MAKAKDLKKNMQTRRFGLHNICEAVQYLSFLGCFGIIVIVTGGILGLANTNVSLGMIAIGLGLVSLAIALSSDERIKAMANLEFREKMAMMYGYMNDLVNKGWKPTQFENKRIEQDLLGALELKKWVVKDANGNVYKEFKDQLQTFIMMLPELDGEADLRSRLEKIKDAAEKDC
jgi:hypothetical protein